MALGDGLRAGGATVRELPVADGGEGTAAALRAARGGEWREADVHDAFGRPRRARWLLLPDRTAVVESAAAVPLDPERLDPLAASSRGYGELVLAALEEEPAALLLCLGGTATMDGGAGFLEVVRDLPVPARAACDVRATLAEAPRLFGPQKGAGPAEVAELERRLAGRFDPGAGGGAAGGLGAALASLGATLEPGAPLVLDAIGFEPAGADLVVTGEGRVDATTALGKAPGEVARRCVAAGVRCAVFGGVVDALVPGAETIALSGDPARAEEDLRALGRELATGRYAR
jgi:glycerate kinase